MGKKVLDCIKPFIIVFIVVGIIMIFFRPATVEGSSMYPTLQAKDILLLKRNIKDLQKGDIVAIQADKINLTLCKRVIGVENDHIQIKEDGLYINDHLIKEDYIYEEEWVNNYVGLDLVVPANNVFVMGDNRNNSSDSRSLGCISKVQILGIMILDFTRLVHINSDEYKILLYILWLGLITYYIIIFMVSWGKNHRVNKKNSLNRNKGGTKL